MIPWNFLKKLVNSSVKLLVVLHTENLMILIENHILIARKSALEKTQLSNVLITDNLF